MWIIALCGTLGCEQLIGLDDFEIAEDGAGEPCAVQPLTGFELDGVCQPAADECPGNTNPGNAAGDCPGELVCCVDEDECESFAPDLTCQATSCADEGGAPIGCPDGQWCCPAE